MGWFTDHPALMWIAVALVLGAVEMLTLDLFFIALAVAVLAGALVAALGLGLAWQVVAIVIAAFLLLGLARPVLRRRFNQSVPEHRTNAAALVGRQVIAMTVVTETSGQVKLAGEIWSARTPPGHPPIGAGDNGRVDAIDGATAIVIRAQESPPPTSWS